MQESTSPGQKQQQETKRVDAKQATRAKIKELEEQISKTKYNKKTQHAIGMYKAQLAVLKTKLESHGKGGKKPEGYTVRKSGDASVVLLGFPSVGKSTLLNKLTNANSEVAAYAFTTLTCIPGLLNYNSAKIQILDVPGIVEGAAAGTGRGKEVLQVVRNADLVLILIDVFYPEHYEKILSEVFDTHVRINQKKPDVKIAKATKGGIDIGATLPLTKLDEETITDICREFRLTNAQIVLREDIDADQLIDIIEKNRVYIPAITVVSKIDLASPETIEAIKRRIHPDLMISAVEGEHMEELKKLIFDKLDFIRVYLKEVQKKPDLEEPMIMKRNSTLRDICEKLHRDFVLKFKFARIWGKSVRFDGQKVLKLDHVILDKDIVELHIG